MALRESNDKSEIAAEQTNKQRIIETDSEKKNLGNIYAKKQKDILTGRGLTRLSSGYTHRNR